MKIDELREALKNGYKASSVLKEVLKEVAELYCPGAAGFEGPETYLDCGKCIVCQAKEIKEE